VTAAASSDCLFCGLVLVPASLAVGVSIRRGDRFGDAGGRGGTRGGEGENKVRPMLGGVQAELVILNTVRE
jgi:hypothetical protein